MRATGGTRHAEPAIIQSKTSLSPCRLRDQRAVLRGVSAGCSRVDAGERATGKMTRHFFRQELGEEFLLLPATCPPSGTAGPGSHSGSMWAGERSEGEGQIANESPSVNTDAHRRGLWQKCSSYYREPFTAGAESGESLAGLCRMGSLPACSTGMGGRAAACQGRP